MPTYELIDIPGIEQEWQTAHIIKALAIDGRCEVTETLEEWAKSSSAEYKHIMGSLRLIGERETYRPHKRFRSVGCSPLFEIKRPAGGMARMYCFPFKERMIVACGTHWKDPKRQDKDIERACGLMKSFLVSCGNTDE